MAHTAELDVPTVIALMSVIESDDGRQIDYAMLDGALQLLRSRSARFVDPEDRRSLIVMMATPPDLGAGEYGFHDSVAHAETYLGELNALMGLHGVIDLRTDENRLAALYVNTGETYDITVLYDVHKRKFELTSWGDWLEWAENTRRPRLHFR
jgi:hypothetical protein